jgi:hypothetical protein
MKRFEADSGRSVSGKRFSDIMGLSDPMVSNRRGMKGTLLLDADLMFQCCIRVA